MDIGIVQQRTNRGKTGISDARGNGNMHYDCLVIGLGGMGSSALYHLARRGLRVCGVEQFDPVHDRGSSHGQHRVFRKAYFEHPDYVPLLQSAERLWRELESESGADLYRQTGVVLSGPHDGAAVAGTLAAARQHDLPVERLDAAEAGRRWPLLRFSAEHDVVLDADAGILAVEECVAQYLHQARQLGAEASFSEPVTEWSVDSGRVTVKTDRATRTADAAIIAGGAWTSTLLTGPWPPLEVRHKLQLWHTVDAAYVSRLQELPAFFFETRQGAFYGMASGASEVKLARHSGGPLVEDPSEPGQGAVTDEYQPCVQFARDHLQGISAAPLRTRPCLYTVSDDGHFIVDHHAESDRVVVAAGFSGHGFKFASVMGAVLADLATTGQTEHPVAFLGAGRFA